VTLANIKQKRVGQIATVVKDRFATANFYATVFGWDHVFGVQSFMGEGISEVQQMKHAAACARWLIDSRPGFQVEIFEYSCPESRPLPKDACVSNQGYNRIIISTRSLSSTLGKLRQHYPQLEVQEQAGRFLVRDMDGILHEVFENPSLIPAADETVMVGVGITVDDADMLSEELQKGFDFKAADDIFEHGQHWQLDGRLEKHHTLQLGDMFVVASQYNDSRQRPADYKLGDIGIMNFAVIHPSMEEFKKAYLHTCSLGMRSNSVPTIIPNKGAVTYQNTRSGANIEMQYLHTSIWGLFGYSKPSWLDHLLEGIATWKARRGYRKWVASSNG